MAIILGDVVEFLGESRGLVVRQVKVHGADMGSRSTGENWLGNLPEDA
jgi:hypothetical protein